MSEEDYIEYNIFHMNHSKSFKKANFALKFVFPVGFTLLILLSHRALNSVFWIILIIGTVMTFIGLPKLIELSLKKRVRAMLHDGKNGDLFTEKEYVFDESGIKVESTNASNYYNWNSVTKFVESDQTFYIYVSSIQAIIIPKAYLLDRGQIDEFRDYISDFIK